MFRCLYNFPQVCLEILICSAQEGRHVVAFPFPPCMQTITRSLTLWMEVPRHHLISRLPCPVSFIYSSLDERVGTRNNSEKCKQLCVCLGCSPALQLSPPRSCFYQVYTCRLIFLLSLARTQIVAYMYANEPSLGGILHVRLHTQQQHPDNLKRHLCTLYRPPGNRFPAPVQHTDQH